MGVVFEIHLNLVAYVEFSESCDMVVICGADFLWKTSCCHRGLRRSHAGVSIVMRYYAGKAQQFLYVEICFCQLRVFDLKGGKVVTITVVATNTNTNPRPYIHYQTNEQNPTKIIVLIYIRHHINSTLAK